MKGTLKLPPSSCRISPKTVDCTVVSVCCWGTLAQGLELAAGLDGLLPVQRPRLEVLGADGQVAESVEGPAAGLALFLGPRIRFF